MRQNGSSNARLPKNGDWAIAYTRLSVCSDLRGGKKKDTSIVTNTISIHGLPIYALFD